MEENGQYVEGDWSTTGGGKHFTITIYYENFVKSTSSMIDFTKYLTIEISAFVNSFS